MVSKLDEQAVINEYEVHWVPYIKLRLLSDDYFVNKKWCR